MLIQQGDLVVVRFGDKYKQWNAAIDAGSYAAAMAWSTSTEQAVEILKDLVRD